MDFSFDPSLVLYVPLHKKDGSSFISDEAYGHLAAVSGALWRPDGRCFDKVDDLITIPAAASITNIFDGGGTVLAWLNPISDGEGSSAYIIGKIDGSGVGWNFAWSALSGGKLPLFLNQSFTGTDGRWLTDNAVVPVNAWSLVGVTYNNGSTGNVAAFTLNGVAQASSTILTPTGTRDTDTGVNMIIGNNLITTRTFDGTIGEVMIYRRTLTPLEIQQNYLATKWRYQ